MSQRGPTSRPSLFVMLWVVASFAASTSTVRAADDECIVKPNSQPPQGQHWYYRTDRESKRQCWYLGPEGAAVRKNAAETSKPFEPHADATPAALASGAANLSQQQREVLFRQFLEWRRSHPAQHAQ
jgi:hypothetical protein